MSGRDKKSIETLKWMAWVFAVMACACAHAGQRIGEIGFLALSVVAGLVARVNELATAERQEP